MKIEARIDEKTFRRFKIFHILKLYKAWKPPVIFASGLSLCALVAFIKHDVDGAVFLGGVLLTVALVLPTVYFSTFFASLRKETKKWKLNPPRLVYTLELDEKPDGIHIANDTQRVSYRWKSAHMAYLDEGCVYLFMTPDQAFLLPYKEEERDRLWALVSKCMKGKCKDVRKGSPASSK